VRRCASAALGRSLPGAHLSIDSDWPLHDPVHAEHGRLGQVDDRSAHERTKDAAVGDRERAAHHVLEREPTLLRELAQPHDLLLHVGEAHALAAAQHGHHEALRRGDGDRDVHVVAVDDVRPVDHPVDGRLLLQGDDGGAHER
jgi:hypothetical protein